MGKDPEKRDPRHLNVNKHRLSAAANDADTFGLEQGAGSKESEETHKRTPLCLSLPSSCGLKKHVAKDQRVHLNSTNIQSSF